MGASNSKIEEDKALQQCRERKKFVRQALDGRCSLAAAHMTYIRSLRGTGAAVRAFVQPEGQIDSSFNTPRVVTPEAFVLTEKSLSHIPSPSPAFSWADGAGQHSTSSSPMNSRIYHTNHMKFQGSAVRKVEEMPSAILTGIVNSSCTPQNTSPCNFERDENAPFSTPSRPSENPPWDYFGLSNPSDDRFPSHDQRTLANGSGNYDDVNQIGEVVGILELDDEAEKVSSRGKGGSQESEDEFDEPATHTLVRSFENLSQRPLSHSATCPSPMVQAEASTIVGEESLNGVKLDSPKLSPLKAKSLEMDVPTDIKITVMEDEENSVEHKIAPKDFFQSMRDVEYLFSKASDSGKEVPRMLEANKFHYRPIMPGKEHKELFPFLTSFVSKPVAGGSMTSTLLKTCFSCGKVRSQIQEEAAQNPMKYLTWHRTASSRCSSSRNPLVPNSGNDTEDLTSDFFENSCMISGSHASTLDRLYAWERKLYDEVKASQIVRRGYDTKCKLLRLQESKGESVHKIDKTRAQVKELHSRIRVAIHKIDSISKRIEELSDQELQPQLEELIEGLRRMWETMSECHKLQLHVISVAHSNYDTKISIHSMSHHESITELKNVLETLSSSFIKWVRAQKSYVQAIENWIHKCVPDLQNSTKRKSRCTLPQSDKCVPLIYTTCSMWLEKLKALPAKEVTEALKILASETPWFLPSQEKTPGKEIVEGVDPSSETLNSESTFEDWNKGCDLFRSNLVSFLKQLTMFADSSVRAYGELQNAIEGAKE